MGRVNTGYPGGYKGTAVHPYVREWTERDRIATRRIESVFIHKPRYTFDEAVQEYRRIEAELVEQAGDDEFDAIETRRRIAEWILTCADDREVSFDICHKAWEDIVALGFSSLSMKCTMVCIYADSAMRTGECAAGLAVMDPMIAEVEQFLAEETIEPMWRQQYETILDSLRRRREGLLAYQISEAEGAAWEEREEARREALENEQPDT